MIGCAIFGKKNLVTIYLHLHNRRLKELLPELTQRIKEWKGKDYIKLKLRDTFQTIPLQHTLCFMMIKVKRSGGYAALSTNFSCS